MIKHMDTSSTDFKESLQAIVSSTSEPSKNVLKTVSKIIADVRARGDDALLEYTNQYDNFSAKIEALQIKKEEIKKGFNNISDSMRSSLIEAARRIRIFHEKQKQETWIYKDDDGNELGQRILPMDRVGVYVPGGKAASVPPIPIGITFAPVRAAKKAAPSKTSPT